MDILKFWLSTLTTRPICISSMLLSICFPISLHSPLLSWPWPFPCIAEMWAYSRNDSSAWFSAPKVSQISCLIIYQTSEYPLSLISESSSGYLIFTALQNTMDVRASNHPFQLSFDRSSSPFVTCFGISVLKQWFHFQCNISSLLHA